MEINVETLKNIYTDMQCIEEDEIASKYDIDIADIEDIIYHHTDIAYIDNDIYHIFPIMSISVMILNIALLFTTF